MSRKSAAGAAGGAAAVEDVPLRRDAAPTPPRIGPFDVHEVGAGVGGGGGGGGGPVVVLFGWVGSSPRLVGKYAAAFLASGARRVYSTTARTLDVFLRPAGLRALARRALELLAERHAGERAVLAYMSNGGAFVHLHILDELRAAAAAAAAAAGRGGGRYEAVRIAGTVFDSAPSYLSMDSMSRAPTEGIRNALVRSAAYWLLRLLLPVVIPLAHGLGAPARFFAGFAADPLPCPALFIYSAHDVIADCTRLDTLVAQRRASHPRGAHGVRALRIGAEEPASPHVAHLASHPERYRRALADLLRDAAAEGEAAEPPAK